MISALDFLSTDLLQTVKDPNILEIQLFFKEKKTKRKFKDFVFLLNCFSTNASSYSCNHLDSFLKFFTSRLCLYHTLFLLPVCLFQYTPQFLFLSRSIFLLSIYISTPLLFLSSVPPPLKFAPPSLSLNLDFSPLSLLLHFFSHISRSLPDLLHSQSLPFSLALYLSLCLNVRLVIYLSCVFLSILSTHVFLYLSLFLSFFTTFPFLFPSPLPFPSPFLK